MIRDATLEDIDEILPLLKSVFDHSIFKYCNYSEGNAQKTLVTLISFDLGYAKVAEKGGKIVGLLAGAISDNQWGVKCSQDIFMFSSGGTHYLIKDFVQWSKDNGAEFIQISDFSGKERYHELIKRSGLKESGTIFIGGL